MKISSTTIRLGAVVAAVALSLAFACPAFASSFSDVSDDAWYGADNEACIEYVAEKGFMTGYAGTDLFGPEDTLTRAQVVTALYRVITGDPDGLTSDPVSYVETNESGFSDTKGGMYYTAALNWAVAEDVARGSAGRFRPNDPVTREEFVTFMARAADFYYPPVVVPWYPPIFLEVPRGFYDRDEVSSWAREGFDYARKYELVEGKVFYEADPIHPPAEMRFFYPQRIATRAEAAAMLMRFNEKVVYYFGVKQGFLVSWWVMKNERVWYDEGRLIVDLDGELTVADGTTYYDFAREVLDLGADRPIGPSEPRTYSLDPALLSLPGSDADDALSLFGNIELIRYEVDMDAYWFNAYITLPEGMTLSEAMFHLMKDDRVESVDLVRPEDNQ
ncbi:MAG: S-layer homology domain-containing protein [Eggerthellaceae bacterium]|nr:S-layer homology domain-containing protein [Eggerthellaceae bacterium]